MSIPKFSIQMNPDPQLALQSFESYDVAKAPKSPALLSLNLAVHDALAELADSVYMVPKTFYLAYRKTRLWKAS